MRTPTAHPAFTLVELLVVIGIITVLMAMLLPVLHAARRSAADVQCASNIRQLCTALLSYATDRKGRFPPNSGRSTSPDETFWWYDQERIGPYISGVPVSTKARTNGLHHRPGLGLGVFVCPNDEGAARSYGVNWWASSFPIFTHPTAGVVNVAAHTRQGSRSFW